MDISLWEREVSNFLLFLIDLNHEKKLDFNLSGIFKNPKGNIKKKKFDIPNNHMKLTKLLFTQDENIFSLSSVVIGYSWYGFMNL